MNDYIKVYSYLNGYIKYTFTQQAAIKVLLVLQSNMD